MKKDECKKRDKYGVCLDSDAYLSKTPLASPTDHTGMVPVAMESSEERENYEKMFNVPVGNVRKTRNSQKGTEKDRYYNKK